MLTIDSYTSIIEAKLSEIKFPPQPERLYAPIRYALEGGGKRLRPVLTLAVCEAFGETIAAAENQAVGVEMFHNFTLLHDDVMDNADVRRGRPTVHKRWDERTAILSGDAMLTLAGMMVGRCEPSILAPTLELFNRTAMEVYEGQQYDMDFETDTHITVAQYMEMIRLKTSVLLGCACALGAIAAHASHQDVSEIYAYGEKLGLAFQLQDDYLDTYGDPMVFGKEIGGDIINDKKTWLRIMAQELDTTGVIDAETEHPSDSFRKITRVRGVYNALGLPDQCRALIYKYIDMAIEHVKRCNMPDEAKEFFITLAQNTANRTH